MGGKAALSHYEYLYKLAIGLIEGLAQALCQSQRSTGPKCMQVVEIGFDE
jgi:hypothetical protein